MGTSDPEQAAAEVGKGLLLTGRLQGARALPQLAEQLLPTLCPLS